MPQNQERTTPYISVNKLGEYLIATPRRRRAIIRDQKNPKPFKVAIYTEAQNAICDYLVKSEPDESILINAIEALQKKQPETEWDENRLDLCVSAIESFLDIIPDLDFAKYNLRRGIKDAPDLIIADVAISIRPEIILQRNDSRDKFGALKLCFSKTKGHTEDTAAYVGTMVQQYLIKHQKGCDSVLSDDCLVVDVFDGEIYTAPRAFKTRLADIEAACEEIANSW